MQTQALRTEPSSSFSGARVFTLQSDQIESAWGWIRKLLERVPSYDWTEADVKRDLMEGKAQLWGATGETGEPLVKGIWITRIENSHSRRWGVVWIAAGNPVEEGLELFQKHTEPWFKSMGCEAVHIYGRAGWQKVLPGYEEKARVLVKELR